MLHELCDCKLIHLSYLSENWIVARTEASPTAEGSERTVFGAVAFSAAFSAARLQVSFVQATAVTLSSFATNTFVTASRASFAASAVRFIAVRFIAVRFIAAGHAFSSFAALSRSAFVSKTSCRLERRIRLKAQFQLSIKGTQSIGSQYSHISHSAIIRQAFVLRDLPSRHRSCLHCSWCWWKV